MIKIYPRWFVFITTNLIGVILIIRSDNWFRAWLGFELSLLTFLPLFVGRSLIVESLVKYFLIQAGGSRIFALSFLLPTIDINYFLLTFRMCLKLGIFPFYNWVPLIIVNLTWYGCILLATIQKLGPLFILCNNGHLCYYFLIFFAVISILIGGLLGYNQTYMRPLIAYSSIRHTGWLAISLLYRFNLFIVYLATYYLLVIILFSIFTILKVNKVVTRAHSNTYIGVTNILILALSGLPPFSLFYLKAAIIYYLCNAYYFIPLVLLGSILSIYYYLNFVIPSLSAVWKENLISIKQNIVTTRLLLSFCLPFILLI
jgi:NADH:ubiquinone oxidoreductase subunit 2 (subunit N)